MNEVYAALAERLKYPKSTYLLKILEKILTPEEGRLVLELPLPAAEIAPKLNRSEDWVKDKTEDLWHRGILWVTPQGRALPAQVWMLHDTVTAVDNMDPEVGKLFKEWYQTEWAADLAKYWIRPTPVLRLIPTIRSLEAFRKVSTEPVADFEDPKRIVESVSLLGLRHVCACRNFMHECESARDVCIQFNEQAEWDISRGLAEKISVDEAIERLYLSDDEGLIHTLSNKATMSQIRSICNCCDCCCIVVNSVLKYGTAHQVLAKTRYETVVDQQACTGCQKCVDRCQFGAIEMVKPAGSKKFKAQIDSKQCWGCGLCHTVCEPGALSLKLVRPLSHIPA